jgi:GTP-binding protein
VILFVVDAQQGLTPVDQDLARKLRKSSKPVVLVINKIDHEKHESLEGDFARLGFESVVPISAAHGRGFVGIVRRHRRRAAAAELAAKAADEGTERPPLALAIIGRPNAGKSSLINAVLQDQRTIVSDIPGTTRDAVDIAYERNGEKFLLIDTAGMRARSKHSTSVESSASCARSAHPPRRSLRARDGHATASPRRTRRLPASSRRRRAAVIVLNNGIC